MTLITVYVALTVQPHDMTDNSFGGKLKIAQGSVAIKNKTFVALRAILFMFTIVSLNIYIIILSFYHHFNPTKVQAVDPFRFPALGAASSQQNCHYMSTRSGRTETRQN